MKRTIYVAVGCSLGAALVGLVAGYRLAIYRQEEFFSLENDIRRGANVDYEDTLVNASVFRTQLRETPNLDTVFARVPFLAKCIRVLWQDSVALEAISIPAPGEDNNFYLIRGDSITQLWMRPRKTR